jgi:hypothetical protein
MGLSEKSGLKVPFRWSARLHSGRLRSFADSFVAAVLGGSASGRRMLERKKGYVVLLLPSLSNEGVQLNISPLGS